MYLEPVPVPVPRMEESINQPLNTPHIERLRQSLNSDITESSSPLTQSTVHSTALKTTVNMNNNKNNNSNTSSSSAIEENTVKTIEKTEGNDTQPSPKQAETKTTWAGLFSRKERGPATYKNFSAPRGLITKNKNTMIIKIIHLSNIATDDLIQALASNYNEIILDTYMRFTKLG